MQSVTVRWLVAVIAAAAIVALVAYARNDPGVGERVPDPPDVIRAVVQYNGFAVS